MSKMIVTGIKKEIVNKPGSQYDKKPYYLAEGYTGPMHTMTDVTLLLSAPTNPTALKVFEEYYDKQIVDGNYANIDIDIVIVNDLPPFQTIRRDGTLNPTVKTSMKVVVKTDGAAHLEDPRAKALRIIGTEKMCKQVVIGGEASATTQVAP